MKKNRKGFTFMEIVATLIIIITLSLLSYPIYTGRGINGKDKLAEGYVLLGYIVNAQIAYYNEYGNFLGPVGSGRGWRPAFDNLRISVDPILGINAVNNRYFSAFDPHGIDSYGDAEYKYRFVAIVKSAKAGTISLEYNLTQRFEPVVSGI